MGRPAEVRKDYLQQLGITDVTTDGRVFVGDIEIKSRIQTKASRYKKQNYKVIHIYDKNLYQAQKEANGGKFVPGKVIGMKGYVLSRVIYAWYHDIAPANMDVDHIDGNSLNNSVLNLQLLTRAENLAKRKGYMNQYAKSFKK